MPRFMMIYKGEATDMSDMTEEQGAEVLAKWERWMAKVGPALVDIGSPFGPGTSVVDDGSSGVPVSLTGYSIVEAGDLQGAESLSTDHPYLSEGRGNFAIDIFAMMPAPFDS
jgi:hypothetical protein